MGHHTPVTLTFQYKIIRLFILLSLQQLSQICKCEEHSEWAFLFETVKIKAVNLNCTATSAQCLLNAGYLSLPRLVRAFSPFNKYERTGFKLTEQLIQTFTATLQPGFTVGTMLPPFLEQGCVLSAESNTATSRCC